MTLGNVFTLDVDIKQANYAYERKVTANDSTTFVINLTNEGLPLDLSSVTNVTLANTRLDQVTVVTPGTKTGANQVTFNLGQNETKTTGRVGAVVQLYDADGRVSMLGFNYTVVTDPTGDTYVPSGDDLTLIQVVLGDGPLVLEQARQATADANTATANTNAAIANAEIATTNAETATANAETATTNANAATTNANNATSAANTATTNANNATSAANTAKTNADTATANANNAASNANTAASNAGNAASTANTAATNANNTATTINNDMKITHKGTVTTYAGLPSSGQQVGDTWVVTTDGTPANNGVWRWQSNSTWLKINNLNLSGAETVSNVGVVAKAAADIARQSVMSGVLDYVSAIRVGQNGALGNAGEIQTPDPGNYSVTLNKFGIRSFNALLNGYKAFIDKANYNGTSQFNYAILPDPPTFGTRDDLVFLEAWFPSTGNGYELSWRIRTVAGVDFGKFDLDGFSKYSSQGYSDLGVYTNDVIGPQGGNANPITVTSNAYFQYYNIRKQSWGNSVSVDDAGLYVAGKGDNTAKSTLQTLDGYVYAIPLFRVKRRNSGGYSVTNLNGARDYVENGGAITISPTIASNETRQLTVSSNLYNWLNAGDYIRSTSVTWKAFIVLSKDGSNKITVQNISSTSVGTDNYCLVSDRPDNLYSNIIDATDIIDLRHKVSLTGFNYQQLLEENFDKLLRGELTTKDTKTTAKEQFNLKKAPLGLAQDLQAVPVKRPFNLTKSDGTQSPLVNLLGDDGNCEDTSKWTPATTTISLDNTNQIYGSNAFKITLTGTQGSINSQNLPLSSSKYYLVLANVKNGNATNVYLRVGIGTGGTSKQSSNYTSTTYGLQYIKLTPSDIGTATNILAQVYVNGTSGQYAYVDGIRLYEIDQATYNLIDSDPNWTGAGNISAKFPYVDSSVQNVALKNLLGMDGNCEDTSKWSYSTSTISLDSTNKTSGNNSIKVTTTTTSMGYMNKNLLLDASKYYLIVADIKNGNVNGGARLRYYNGTTTYNKTSSYVTDTSKFITTYLKVQPSELSASDNRVYFDINGNASGQYAYMDGIRLYEIDQATYNLIDVDPNYTGGDKIAALFPYVDSPVNFVENLCPDFTQWTLHANAKVDNLYQLTLSATGANQESKYEIPVSPSSQYTFSYGNGTWALVELDSSNTIIKTTTATQGITITTLSNTAKIRVVATNSASGTFSYSNPKLELGSTANPFVPFGRWYLPYDYALNQTKTYLTESFNQHRQTFSDAQTSETVTDRVEALMTPQKHISVTQATPGQWAVNDTIKVTSYNGVVSGVIDSDTGISKMVQDGNNSNTIYLDDVSKFAVNDTVKIQSIVSGSITSDLSITAIDTTNKTITFAVGNNVSYNIGSLVIETTTASSVPTVTATGIAGTWSGLGTKTATYTITTAPTTNTTDIVVKYSVNYPAGKGIVNVPTDVLQAEVNGQKLVTGGTVSVKANFDGKVSGSTDLVPHYMCGGYSSTLLTPSAITYETQGDYNLAMSLNGSSSIMGWITTNGQQAQHAFKFDLIRLIEDKYGETAFVGCVTVADKVAWLKDNTKVVSISLDWYGYGSSPTGNKASLTRWYTSTNSWSNSPYTNTASTPTKITWGTSGLADIVDPNGFVYYLAYADPSDGVTASTIYTDYVELSVTLNTAETGYTVFQPENLFPVLSENILTANQAFPVDVSDFSASGAAMNISNLGELQFTNVTAGGVKGYISQIVLKADYYTYSADVYVDPSATVTSVCIADDGTFTGATYDTQYYDLNKKGTWQRLRTIVKLSSSDTTGTFGLKLAGYSASDVYKMRYIKLEKGSNPNPQWTSGRNKKKVLNFLGKVAGSTVENGNRLAIDSGSTFWTPSNFNSMWQADNVSYTNVSKQDGVLLTKSTSTNGNYCQHLFEFDLSHLGLSLSQLKSMLRKLTVNWTGYGSGSNAGVVTNGATLKWWNNDNQNWTQMTSNTTNSPSTTTSSYSTTPTIGSFATKDQKVYVLVHSTYASDGIIASNIYTDYINLVVELSDQVDYQKANIVKVRPETKEIKTQFPTVTYRMPHNGGREDRISLWYRYVPYQGSNHGDIKILCVSDKVVLTTSGTGYYPTLNTPYKNLATRIPFRNVISNTFSLVYDKLVDVSASDPGLTMSNYMDIAQSYDETEFNYNGSIRSALREGTTVYQNISYAALNGSYAVFEKVSSQFMVVAFNKNVLADCIAIQSAIGLTTDNKLCLLIIGTGVGKGKNSGLHGSSMIYEIQGRPLVKGV